MAQYSIHKPREWCEPTRSHEGERASHSSGHEAQVEAGPCGHPLEPNRLTGESSSSEKCAPFDLDQDDVVRYFYLNGSMKARLRIMKPTNPEQVVRYADMFAALGAEARLRIVQLLLSAHPVGRVVGEIQRELGLSASNLSHHLDKLKNEGLVQVDREGTYLRCRANADGLQQLLGFLYSECCARSKAISISEIVKAEA